MLGIVTLHFSHGYYPTALGPALGSIVGMQQNDVEVNKRDSDISAEVRGMEEDENQGENDSVSAVSNVGWSLVRKKLAKQGSR